VPRCPLVSVFAGHCVGVQRGTRWYASQLASELASNWLSKSCLLAQQRCSGLPLDAPSDSYTSPGCRPYRDLSRGNAQEEKPRRPAKSSPGRRSGHSVPPSLPTVPGCPRSSSPRLSALIKPELCVAGSENSHATNRKPLEISGAFCFSEVTSQRPTPSYAPSPGTDHPHG
jgi:hypothetical protein